MTPHNDDLETAVQLAYAKSLDAEPSCPECGHLAFDHREPVGCIDAEPSPDGDSCERCHCRRLFPDSPEPGASSGEEA